MKLFRIGFKKQADVLGIVCAPTEIVDLILRATDTASGKHFGRGLTDEGMHILDGFTGTGTFITRPLESDLITAKDLEHKYSAELGGLRWCDLCLRRGCCRSGKPGST